MKKAFVLAGVIALTVTPTTSFGDHLVPQKSEIKQGGNLQHTDLSGANLFRHNLAGANLTGANLSDANLSVANLNGANLTDVNLTGANLFYSDLRSANLTGIIATNLRDCPVFLPPSWVCKNKSLIKR